MSVSQCPVNHQVDILKPTNFTDRMPAEELLAIRDAAPIMWWEDEGSHGDGFWLVTNYDDVVEVSRRPKVFSSYERLSLLERSDRQNDESLDVQRMMMLNMDPPEHTRLRAIVQQGFTPRMIEALREKLEERTARILDEAIEKGEGDFVVDVAAELPLEAIAELMGVPLEDRHKIFDWSNRMIGSEDPEYAISKEHTEEAGMELYAYANQLKAEKEACPAEDIISTLIKAEVNGEKLTGVEFELFFLLLAVAGNETTRNAISHGMQAFFDNPEQWEIFKEQRPLQTAADEIVRWATPVMHFQRTATEDTELSGQKIKKGDRLAIHYWTANRDPKHFENPHEFNILRDPNPHIGFGGGGPHFCLGRSLAQLEIEIMFNRIADRMPDIRPTGEHRRLTSFFINGITSMPVAYA